MALRVLELHLLVGVLTAAPLLPLIERRLGESGLGVLARARCRRATGSAGVIDLVVRDRHRWSPDVGSLSVSLQLGAVPIDSRAEDGVGPPRW